MNVFWLLLFLPHLVDVEFGFDMHAHTPQRFSSIVCTRVIKAACIYRISWVIPKPLYQFDA